jgi:hypothetical protein
VPADRWAALAKWSGKRGVRPVVPRHAPILPLDARAIDAAERALANFAGALSDAETAAARAELRDAYAALENHAAHPATAWVRSEVERALGTVISSDETEKRALLARANRDGGRLSGMGEHAPEPPAEGPTSAAPGTTSTTRMPMPRWLASLGARVFVNGREVSRVDGNVERHANATDAHLWIVGPTGFVWFGGWQPLRRDGALDFPDAPPVVDACTAEDLALPAPRCGRWILLHLASNPPAASLCAGATCAPRETLNGGGTGSSWIGWALGAAAVAGAGVAIAVVAASPTSPPPERQFVAGGLRIR